MRRLFSALAGSHLAGPQLQRALRQLERMGERVAAAHDLTYDTPVSGRAAFTMVVGMAIFEADLFPGDAAGGRERIIDEITAMITGAATQPRRVGQRVRGRTRRPSSAHYEAE